MIGHHSLDYLKHQVLLDGELIHLTRNEYRIIA